MKFIFFIIVAFFLTFSKAGTCGKTCNYTLADNKLTITGSGKMDDYDSELKTPWKSSYTKITAVEVSGITHIGKSAFRMFYSLLSLKIGDTVETIGNEACFGCEKLTTLEIGKKVKTIGMSAFSSLESLTTVTIPDSVTKIENQAFFDNYKMKTVTMGKKVEHIGDYAFAHGKIESIEIPVTCTYIGAFAFYSTSLSKVTYYGKDEVTKCNDDGFYGTGGLSTVTVCADYSGSDFCGQKVTKSTDKCKTEADEEPVEPEPTQSSSEPTDDTDGSGNDNNNDDPVTGEYCNTDKTCKWKFDETLQSLTISGKGKMNDFTSSSVAPWSEHKTKIVAVIVQDGITGIGNQAFKDFSSLTTVTIASSVVSIGSSAFEGCSQLSTISIPNSITTLSNYVFYKCASLTTIVIGDAVTSVGNYAFAECTGLKSVFIGTKVATIGNYAFYNCYSLTSVEIPDSVTSIGNYAFAQNMKITTFTFGNSVKTIGDFAFQQCLLLQSLTLPSTVTSVGSRCFVGCISLTSVVFEGTKEPGTCDDSAFDECTNLKEISVKSSYSSTDFCGQTVAKTVTSQRYQDSSKSIFIGFILVLMMMI